MTGTINTAERQLYDLCFLEQMDDKNFIVQIIVLFLHDTHNDLGDMKRAFDANDCDTVYRTAHKLKSSTGMLQANALFTILEKIEKIAKARRETSQLDELLQTAQYEFDQLKTALELHLREIDN